jgi:triosephosphate isomerase
VRRHLVVGNWKMYGGLAANRQLLQDVLAGLDDLPSVAASVDLAVCVPFPYLAQVQSILAGSVVAWGAQNVCAYTQGAYTGEVSVAMLQDFACRYVLLGHSERRAIFAESDALVAEKCAAALAGGLRSILCVGETLAQREAGQTMSVVAAQLDAVLRHVGVAALSDAVLAYEPVWAIGTGRTASPEQAQEVHAAIRAQVAGADARVAEEMQILYGGSVKPQNAAELFAMPDIDGGLIGGASLGAEDFLAICHAASC